LNSTCWPKKGRAVERLSAIRGPGSTCASPCRRRCACERLSSTPGCPGLLRRLCSIFLLAAKSPRRAVPLAMLGPKRFVLGECCGEHQAFKRPLHRALSPRGLTRVSFLKTCENEQKTQGEKIPLLDRRGVRRTGWSMANLAQNRGVWVFFRRFQSTTPAPSCPGGELILLHRREKPTPVSPWGRGSKVVVFPSVFCFIHTSVTSPRASLWTPHLHKMHRLRSRERSIWYLCRNHR